MAKIKTPATVFDLRSEYIGGRPSHSGPVEIENPYDARQKIVVFRKLRDDPLGRMHDRKQIKEAPYLAGRTWQRYYELAERGAKAIDPTREYVDGGQIASSTISDKQAEAFRKIAEANAAVRAAHGLAGVSVIWDVLAGGMSVRAVAEARGRKSHRDDDFYGRLFRECMDELAKVFGFWNGRRGERT